MCTIYSLSGNCVSRVFDGTVGDFASENVKESGADMNECMFPWDRDSYVKYVGLQAVERLPHF